MIDPRMNSLGLCRFCDTELVESMVDLGLSPLCEDFIRQEELGSQESFFPLQVFVCTKCWLVQADEYSSNKEIFDDDYGYFSSYSDTWLAHARSYVEMAIDRFSLDRSSCVVEIASNDGYLLKNFVDRKIPCLGVDPAANVAKAAEAVGVSTRVEFFTEALAKTMAKDGQQADLLIANNVMAHTPYLKDFVAAIAALVAPTGRATIEFPHLLRLLDDVQFDTIYHEHFSYFSLYTISEIFRSVDMEVIDVEELTTHGGSLRVFVEHAAKGTAPLPAVAKVLDDERVGGLRSIGRYREFGGRAAHVKHELLKLLIDIRQRGKSIAGYGAPGKGNTLLNYCGIKTDLLPYTCDRSKHKHGRFTPGSRIPIFPPERIDQLKPDYILILPWNLREEVILQLRHARDWGAKFIVAVPIATIVD